MRTLFIGMFICLCGSGVQAMPGAGSGEEMSRSISVPYPVDVRLPDQTYVLFQSLLHVAENTEETTEQPESGSLIIPGEDEDKQEKQCLNVCKKWGENCIINPRTGSRDCRRTCKEFGMECF